MLVTDRATQLPAIYNYYFVKNDWSHGVHNTKYAVALLQASMSRLTGVEPMDQSIPETRITSYNVCYTKLLRRNTLRVRPM